MPAPPLSCAKLRDATESPRRLGAGDGANDADQCVHLGYMRDGVPVYGYCKDSSGTQFTSCYSVLSTSDTEIIETVAGDFEVASNISDYEFDQVVYQGDSIDNNDTIKDAYDAGTCNLDKGSGQ